MINEREVEKYLIKKVRENNGLCLKFVSPNETGVPDRIVIFPKGKVYFVELKRPKGGVKSAKQEVWERRLKEKDCMYICLKNKEEVREFIEGAVNE